MEAALELAGVSKSWGDFSLRDVSFRLPPGYITGLVGPNGAGKTTLVRIALDLVRADAGSVRIFGRDHRTAGHRLRSRIGFVHDRPTPYEHLRVERLGALVASFYPTWDEETFRRTIREFGLPARRKVSALSRGMKVKLGLALALSHQAELLVLDEPSTGLDPVFRRELLERLSGLIADGRTAVLFSTQILSDLERIADFVVFLRRGEVLYEGVKDDLMDHWAMVRAAPEVASELEGLPVRGMRSTRMGIEVLVADREAALRRLGDRAVVERATLDDVFLMLETPRSEEGRR